MTSQPLNARFKLVSAILAVAWLMTFTPPPAAGGGAQTLEGLKLELISETSKIKPGVPFKVGLKIEHATGFHTYWKNPGIVGVPTQLKWELPEGFKAGPIEWPAPVITKMAVYPVYGYEGNVLLPVTITPPPSLDPDLSPEIELSADASWMCCAKTCHPGFTTVSISLPSTEIDSADSPTKHKALFEAADRARPIKTEAWKATAIRHGSEIALKMIPEAGEIADLANLQKDGKVYFFSGDGLIDSTAEQSLTVSPDSSSLHLSLKVSEHASEASTDKARLTGVLVGKNSWEKGKTAPAIEIDTRILSAPR